MKYALWFGMLCALCASAAESNPTQPAKPNFLVVLTDDGGWGDYAFREGRRRGLVVFNLDVRQSHPVRVEFSGNAAGGKAQQWLLTADRVSATNEPEEPAPQVSLREQALTGFCSGKTIELPKHSMMTVVWEIEK